VSRAEVVAGTAPAAGGAEGARAPPPLRTGALDVLAQHVLGCACGAPFMPDELFKEVRTAAPFAGLTRADFDAVVDFVATGGYALKVYERFAKIRRGEDGRYRISHPRIAQQYRLNVGTSVEETMIKVRLVRSGAGATAPATPSDGRPLPHLRGRAREGTFPTALTGGDRPLPGPPPQARRASGPTGAIAR